VREIGAIMQQNPVGRATAETGFHSSYYLRKRGKNVSLISISRTTFASSKATKRKKHWRNRFRSPPMGSLSFRWASRNARALDCRNVRSSLGFNSSSARV